MSSLNSVYIISPANKSEECSQMIITDIRETFSLLDVALVGQKYTLSLWVRSDDTGTMIVNGAAVETSPVWTKYINTYEASNPDVVLGFGAVGTYYLYHAQLEIGNIASDWTRAPEDIDEAIGDTKSFAEAQFAMLSDMIASLVTDASGTSLMTQTGSGWTFNIGGMQSNLNTVISELDTLTGDLRHTDAVLGTISEYVKIGTFEGSPCIELGENDSDFRLLITNTRIVFMEGSDTPTYINNKTLNTDKIKVKSEFQQGNFVWVARENGNLGIIWKGGS